MPTLKPDGLRASVSRVPGAPPRTSAAATALASGSRTVTPVQLVAQWAWPTVKPSTSVIVLRGPGRKRGVVVMRGMIMAIGGKGKFALSSPP